MEQALFIWAFIQSFLFGGTVLVYRNNLANRILSSFFFLVSVLILFQYLLKYELWLFIHPIALFIPDLINIAIGPVLLGAAKPVHILTASTTVRRIVNMTALTVADANATR